MANKGSSLATNQSLNTGDFLVSPNSNFTAIMQDDGNFVVYEGKAITPFRRTVIWASEVAPGVGNGPYRAIMQDDGNFVVYERTGGRAIWATGIVPGAGSGPYRAVMQDDGNFVIYQGAGEGTAIWAVNGPRGSSLANNQTLNMGAYLTSPNGNYKAIMQNDGNFVMYQGTAGGSAVWASGVVPGVGNGPYRAVMQVDGNFVIYQGTGEGTAIWASGVVPGIGNGPYHAGMQNDGNFVVYQGTGRHAIWSINDIPYFYGNAGIPRGQNATEVGHRYINADSLVFLTVDTTAVPGADVALPGVRLNNRGQGFITIATLDESAASEPCGIPLSYLVVNQLSGTMGPLSYTTGTGVMPANTNLFGINAAAASPDSAILLTVDATSINEGVNLPGLKVNDKFSGQFIVSTLGLENAPSTGIPFNWMIVNGGLSLLAGSGNAIPQGVHNIGVSSAAVSIPAAVFLTVDASSIPGAEVALPGVKVNNHGPGWFTVTTEGNTNAPSTGVPFDWLVVQPPPRWEEYGPIAASGNCWTMAFDPANWQVVYCGSTWGGVWKTIDGGQNWAPTWDQPQVGIYRLLVDPTTSGTIYALDFNMQVWISLDAGESWNQLPSSPPSLTQAAVETQLGAVMTRASDGTLWIASLGGLAKLPPPLIGSTWILDNPDPSNAQCTDVAIGRDGTVYAAIQGSGVYRLPSNQAQWEIINSDSSIVQKPMRLAVGQNTIVLNANLDIYTQTISTLPGNDWVDRGQWCCDGQGGYALSVGISPSDDNHFLAFGSGGWATFTGGATHFPDHDPTYVFPPSTIPLEQLAVGQDDHQVVFFDDQHLGLATDNGPRFSSDGGKYWYVTEIGPSRITQGPPISQFYNLKVSQPDQFGRVLVTGDVQDAGSQSIIGNQFGMPGGGGEIGLSVPAAPFNSQDTTYNMPSATFHFYGINGGKPKELIRTLFNVPGPYYVAPPGTGETDESFPVEQFLDPTDPTSVVNSDGTSNRDFPENIVAIATHPERFDLVLIGLANGDVYHSVVGSQGAQFKLLMPSRFGTTQVTSINFVTASLVYVGYQNGGLVELTDPFADSGFESRLTISTQRVITVALDSGVSPARLYIAHSNGVWGLENDGNTWSPVTGPQTSGLGFQLASVSGLGIAGMALDPVHRFLYVATGVDASPGVWRAISGSSGTVWRKSLDLGDSAAWTNFGTGFPDGVPVTGLGVGPDRGLFISTRGRGVWWRRDLTG